jgi:hypothetical protein
LISRDYGLSHRPFGWARSFTRLYMLPPELYVPAEWCILSRAMSDTSTFPLPLTGLELPRFLLTLDQTLSGMPGARVTFVELDALLADEPATAMIEITMHRSLVEACRAPGDPELPDEEEEFWSAEFALIDDGDETTLNVHLERNAYVMPAVVKIVEDVLQRFGAAGGDAEDAEDADDEDEELEDEDEDSDEDDDDEFDEDEDSDDEFEDEDDADDDDETKDSGEVDVWDAAGAFEQLRSMAQNTFGETKPDGEGSFSFHVTWEDPPAKKEVRVRSFVPTVAMGQGDQASWVALECAVCPMPNLACNAAAGLNTEVDFTLSLDGDMYIMSQSFALRSVDGSLFVEMAIALAEQADMLNTAIEQGILENA